MKYSRPHLITRQEVADLSGLSYDVIARNEQRLGLDQARVQINQRVIYYNEQQVISSLVSHQLLVVVDNGTS